MPILPSGWSGAGSATTVVTGYVEDLDAVYRDSSLFVAPLIAGAGVKFKVLDAMASGLPVIATPIAAEGIVEDAGESCFAAITEDPESWPRGSSSSYGIRRPPPTSALELGSGHTNGSTSGSRRDGRWLRTPDSPARVLPAEDPVV